MDFLFLKNKGIVVCNSAMNANEFERKLLLRGFLKIERKFEKNEINLDVKNIPARTIWGIIDSFHQKKFPR